jgi:hypothetical protein
MTYALWSYNRIKAWNPSGCRLNGTIRNLASLIITDLMERVHLGGVIIE